MTALHIVLTVIQVILAVALVAIVTIQSGKSAGLSSAIGGGSGESFLSKNKGKGLDAKLARATKWTGVKICTTKFLSKFLKWELFMRRRYPISPLGSES